MIYRFCLFLLSVLFSCTAFAQEDTANKPQEPILGYYHLGMSFDEYCSQAQKMKEATEVTDSTTMMSKYLISISGIAFDVSNLGFGVGIGILDYNNYTKDTLPLFFTGSDYMLEGKLVSVTVCTPYLDTHNGYSYMPVGLYEQEHLPDNQCRYDALNVQEHNQLISLTEKLVTYLSKKYGTPIKEYPLAKLQPLRKDEIFRQISAPWFILCESEAILPKAEWQSGNMKILMGITRSATIFISFFDDQQLSHQNLDRIFVPADSPKPAVEW